MVPNYINNDPELSLVVDPIFNYLFNLKTGLSNSNKVFTSKNNFTVRFFL
jgi:hypothetical protein